MSRSICAKSYSGLWSGSYCSGISLLCLLYACMYNDSQISILAPFWQCFSNCSVAVAVPYSCLLCRICVAWADVGLLPLMYLVCSLCLVLIDLPDCPTYTFLNVLQFILYTPGGSLFLVFYESCWNIVFVFLKAIFWIGVFEEAGYFIYCRAVESKFDTYFWLW
jgi:hypothetical protein